VAAEVDQRDGEAVPGGAALPFSQAADAVRTNTDAERVGLLARYAATLRSGVALAATVLHVQAEKGVAPESHLDPAAESVRYWRYPDWVNTMLVGNGAARVGAARVDGTLWAARFGQTIAQYADATYTALDSEQTDRDETAGARVLVTLPTPVGDLVGSGFGLVSTHRQQVTAGGVAEPEETFRQAEASAGLEWHRDVSSRFRTVVGVGADAFAPTETAGREPTSTFLAAAFVARGTVDLAPGRTLRAGVSRKTRFPSMRELYGESLGRFAVNPDLRPEAAWLAEVGVRSEAATFSGEAVLFARHTEGTIEQERLDDGRRRRINLGGSRALGIEVSAAARLAPALRADGSVTLMRLRGYRGDERGLRLTEKPEALGRLALTVAPPRGLTGAAEVIVTGRAVSPGADGLVDLPASAQVNLRAGYRLPLRGGAFVEAFARVENVADATTLPQAGLPAPGRTGRLGLRLLY
jgi:iron complex outermembrane receptor protein